MGMRNGSYFEESIERLFRKAGFKTRMNKKINDYEIDVIAEYGDKLIVIECKDYEKSTLTVRNIIHQWNSKIKTSVNADKIVIAIVGQHVSLKDRELAKSLDIILWDNEDIKKYKDLDLDGVNIQDVLFKELGLNFLKSNDKFINLFTSPEKLLSKLKEKTEIEKIKNQLKYFPILSLKGSVESHEGDFKFTKEHSFFVDLNKTKIQLDSPIKLNKENFIEKQKGEQEDINLNLDKIEDRCIKEIMNNSQGKYYFSELKSRFEDLKGIYCKDKEELFKKVKNCYKDELEDKIDDINYRYSPKIEDIKVEIKNVEMDIEHLEKEKKRLKGTWGFKGETDSEKRKNKERHKRLIENQQRKRVKITQMKSRSDVLKKRMNDEKESVHMRNDKTINNSVKEKNFVPKKYDVKITQKDIIWFPELKGNITTKDKIRIPLKIGWDKIYQIGQCNTCNLKFTDVNSIKFCELCNNIFCQEHMDKCNECHKKICKDCSWKCDSCKKVFCNDEKKIKCHECKKELCEKCIIKCELCKNNFCSDHIDKCHICKKSVCKKDSQKCPICKKVTCNNCFEKCKGCNKEVCKDEFVKCSHCGKKICKSCVRYKRKFLVVKQERCVFCIDEN